ncbi:GyrI-like domain-containing protein [Paenibacillus rhizoplanae]
MRTILCSAYGYPRSGYEADDRPCLEFCLNNPAQDPQGKCRVDLYVPIRPSA